MKVSHPYTVMSQMLPIVTIYYTKDNPCAVVIKPNIEIGTFLQLKIV